MLSLSRIIVAYDFSRCSERALAYGADLAARTGAEVHLLYAEVLHGEPFGPPPASDHPTARLEQELRRVRPDEETGGLPLRRDQVRAVVVRDLAAAPAILSYAAASEADLIVMGTHGRRGLRHLVLGSTAEEVMRQAPCPVLTVREGTAPPAGISRMLVPVDFSEASGPALTYAKELAAAYGAELDVLHVIEEVFLPSPYGVEAPPVTPPQTVLRTEKALQEAVDAAPGADVPVEAHVRTDHPAQGILDFASERPVDLIVVATHGWTGMRRLLLGSVTERVVRAAPCPVLVVRAVDEAADPVSEEAGQETSADRSLQAS